MAVSATVPRMEAREGKPLNVGAAEDCGVGVSLDRCLSSSFLNLCISHRTIQVARSQGSALCSPQCQLQREIILLGVVPTYFQGKNLALRWMCNVDCVIWPCVTFSNI